MARARRQPTTPTSPAVAPLESAPTADASSERAATTHAPGTDRDSVERERALDLIVQLAGTSIRAEIDAEDPRHDRLLAWMAAEARAALSHAERVQLARDGEALLRRVRARRGAAHDGAPDRSD